MTDSTANTITVASHFGDKQVTKQEFTSQWVDHAKQLQNIDYSDAWRDEMETILASVKQRAEFEFDRVYMIQADLFNVNKD